MRLTPVETRILAGLDESALIDNLIDLVRVPSITGSDAESELQARQSADLTTWGFSVDAWKFDLDELRAHPLYPGTEAERSEGYGVVGTIGGDTSPALVLQGHVDVVPTGDLEKWMNRDPFSGAIFDGALHGRGACDMKAGVAANMAVARTLASVGVTLERPLAIHAVVSEEDGGLGAFATMLRGHGGDAAVLTEPTSGQIVTANAGALTFELIIDGRAAHGSARLEGVSAFEAFLPIYSGLQELERERNIAPDPLFSTIPLPYPISIGRINSGDWASSVPDRLAAEGRLGVQLGEDPAAARAAFENRVATICESDPWLRDNPARVTWPGGQFASGRLRDDHPFIDEMEAAIVDLSGGANPLRSAAPYGSDLRLYSDIGGIPSLHFGPGDVRFAHAPREQVNIKELVAVTQALLVLTVRRCEAHF
ncbi:MAG: ArgE/DapE family deacylase [Salinibacterium sp.]|nr:ArgE/DapE family deacylase [Salinibacterium sp.]